MKNATLVIHNVSKFENDIWQTDTDDFTTEEWKEAIAGFNASLANIYELLDKCEDVNPFDQYVLGDVINMLNSIDVAISEENA